MVTSDVSRSTNQSEELSPPFIPIGHSRSSHFQLEASRLDICAS